MRYFPALKNNDMRNAFKQASFGASITEYALILAALVVGVIAVTNGDAIQSTLKNLLAGSLNGTQTATGINVPSYGSLASGGSSGADGDAPLDNGGFDTTDSNNVESGASNPIDACQVMGLPCDEQGQVVIDVAASLGSQEIVELLNALLGQLGQLDNVDIDSEGNVSCNNGGDCPPLINTIVNLANSGHAVADELASIEDWCLGGPQGPNGGTQCGYGNDGDNAQANLSNAMDAFMVDWAAMSYMAQSGCDMNNPNDCSANPFTPDQWAIISTVINIVSLNTMDIANTVDEGLGANGTLAIDDGSMQVNANSNTVCNTTQIAGFDMPCVS